MRDARTPNVVGWILGAVRLPITPLPTFRMRMGDGALNPHITTYRTSPTHHDLSGWRGMDDYSVRFHIARNPHKIVTCAGHDARRFRDPQPLTNA